MELNQPEAFVTDFDGVFRFSNPTDDDFMFMWNNKEYLFPAQKTTPMIIANETLENIQNIRKKAAYKLAMREFYSHSKLYKQLVKQGGLYPSVPDEKFLEPVIEMCLKPLPMAKSVVREGKKHKLELRGSKAIDGKTSVNVQFPEQEESAIGEMPDAAM